LVISHRRTLRAAVVASTLFAGCHGTPGAAPDVTFQTDSARASVESGLAASSTLTAPSPASLAPLQNIGWLERLALADGGSAYVTPPVGAREPRPLIVAVHGAGDRPEWACGGWRLAASDYPFVVCPQGVKMDALRFAWDAPHTIEQRVEGALDAVRARFGPYVATGPVIYVGFSQGATMAGPTLLEGREHFPVVMLAEGGYDLMRDRMFLRRLRTNGTSRLMIVCGGAACFRTSKDVQSIASREGLEVLSAGDPLSGHNLNQRMQDALRAAWPSLVAGLPNWATFADYLAAREGR
jgi:predicted esterase